jgi:hypothetical protein
MKWLKRIVASILIVVVIILLFDAYLLFGFAKIRPEIKQADAIVVLGAAINSKIASNRALEGLRLYKDGKAPVIIASGGKIADPDISEAQYIEKIIKKNSDEPPLAIITGALQSLYKRSPSKALLEAILLLMAAPRTTIASACFISGRILAKPKSKQASNNKMITTTIKIDATMRLSHFIY